MRPIRFALSVASMGSRGSPSRAGAALARVWVGVLAAVIALAGLPLAGAYAEAGDYRVVDGGSVYIGNARLFSRPSVVRADSVYREISEYREILDKGLTDKDARYHFLMKKASEKFLDATRQMAKELDFDLVAEVGAVKATKRDVATPPDRTDDIVSRLR